MNRSRAGVAVAVATALSAGAGVADASRVAADKSKCKPARTSNVHANGLSTMRVGPVTFGPFWGSTARLIVFRNRRSGAYGTKLWWRVNRAVQGETQISGRALRGDDRMQFQLPIGTGPVIHFSKDAVLNPNASVRIDQRDPRVWMQPGGVTVASPGCYVISLRNGRPSWRVVVAVENRA